MGVTTVLPEMDFSRPASADPTKAARRGERLAGDAGVRVAGGVARAERALREDGRANRVAAAGVFVRRTGAGRRAATTLACVAHGAKMHTPYGATECLPVATIEAAEVLGETAARTDAGRRRVRRPEVRFDRMASDSHHRRADRDDRRCGRIAAGRNRRADRPRAAGVARVCHADASANCRRAKICRLADRDASGIAWATSAISTTRGRFWYCGRKSQRVETGSGPLFTECVEAVFNTHPDVRRSALVGIGPRGRADAGRRHRI